MDDGTLELSKEEKMTLLLKEYELCQDAAQSLESTIWQTSTVIGIGSIGTLVLVASQPIEWPLTVSVGLPIIFANWIWWGMARRWWSIQHAKYCRMFDIEQHLRVLYQTTYVRYLDDLHDPKNGVRGWRNHRKREEDKQRLKTKLKEKYCLTAGQESGLLELSHQHLGVQFFIRLFPFVSTIAWILYWVLE
jgi:hypothetical protein